MEQKGVEELVFIDLTAASFSHAVFSALTLVCVAVALGTLYLVRTDLNCSSVASVRTPVGSK